MPARPRRKFGPSQKQRIFFAALPDVNTAARIFDLAEKLKRANKMDANLILPEHLHVTLFHLGDWAALPDEIVRIAKVAAGQVTAPSFDVEFTRSGSFRNRTGIFPFVLTGDVTEWRGLYDALAQALQKNGLGGATKGSFEPHVTLTYDEVRAKPAPIAPVKWTVRDFVLVHSELGKTKHHHLGRWPLAQAGMP